jgi:hypothetical protein
MKWLAIINLRVVVERLGTFKSALFLLIIISLCLFVGYRIGNYYHHFQEKNLEQQQIRLAQLYQQQELNTAQIHSLEVELTVEQLANKQVEKLLKEALKHEFELKKQLAFYEKIMAPEKDVEGLLIDNVKISSGKKPNQFTFQVTLVQQRLKRRYSKGYIDLSFAGSEQEQPQNFNLSQVSTLKKKSLAFSFQYFQIIEGDFTLPENFIPDSYTVSAILTKSRWQKYAKIEEQYTWQINQQP